ncbi:MAG TPA: hypothetical protein VEV87_01530, partial [Chitinophagaceae bacterium]|nr:hypothetical protein [Chitinophagaceae bacterium]
MRSKLYSIAGIGFVTLCLYFAFNHSTSEFKEEPTQLLKSEEGGKPDNPQGAVEFELNRTRDPITRKVHRERLDKAREIQLRSFAEQQRTGIFTPVSGVSFTERGPDNVGGRTRAIMYDLNDPAGMKVWAGGVGGGLWWTINIAATPTVWNKVSDTLNRLSVTCITQSRSFTTRNKMFFGTGEGWLNFDAIRGNGIWRSLDGGTTWTHLLFTKNNPNFSNVLDIQYADNMGGPCSPGEVGVLAATDSGVFKSSNDGDTWTKVLGKGIAGATIDPAADLETEYYWTYATLGKIHNGGGGIWRSCDAGATWERIYTATADEERIDVSPHYQDGWVVWALVQGVSGTTHGIKKIMKSTDADAMPASSVNWPIIANPSWCDNGT